MHPQLRAFLEANGLRAGATEQEAWDHYAKLQAEGIEYQGAERAETDQTGSRAAGSQAGGQQRSGGDGGGGDTDAGGAAPDPDEIQRQIDEGVQRGIAAETQRSRAIEDVCARAGMGAQAAREMVDQGLTIDQARERAFDHMAKTNPPIGAGTGSRMELGLESRDKFRAAVLDGLLLRSGVRIENPADGHREFRGRSLSEIARESLVHAGVSVRGLTRNEIALRALSPASSSDFPYLVSELSGRVLLAGYNEWPATWRQFVAVGNAVDFKNIYGIKLSEAPDLVDLDETGEFKTADLSENQESYRVTTKGRKIKLTRVMIINDDLRAFTRIPRLFGSAAKRMESDMVYSLIVSNPTMNDGVTLFHADHGNLDAAAALSTDSLSTGRVLMRKQTGLGGSAIDVMPAFLLVPVALETNADVILRSAALPTADMSAGVVNPWAGKLTPIAEPRLDAASATGFYLLAHPDQVPTIEVAWLEGEEQPYVDSEVEFGTEALSTVVRHDFGCGIVDHVGAVYNAGA